MEQVNRRLFCNGSPVVNMAALAEEEFKIAGEIMASSIVQGGPAPGFLSSSMYAYIVNGVGSVRADDADEIVEDLHMKNAINKVPGYNLSLGSPSFYNCNQRGWSYNYTSNSFDPCDFPLI